jgi:hypothetical protein
MVCMSMVKNIPGGAYMHDDAPAALYSSHPQALHSLGKFSMSPPLLKRPGPHLSHFNWPVCG